MTQQSHPPSEITCLLSTELLSAQRDSDISIAEATALTQHLQRCPWCQVAGKQFGHLFSTLDELLVRP